MMRRLRPITSIAAITAVSYLTVLVLGAGIVAACEGGGGGGGCVAPTVSTGSATSITSNSATLNGSVNAQGCETTYTFEWGTSASGSYPDSVTSSAGNGTSPKSVSSNLPAGILQPSTKYNFRLKASNSGGTTTGGTNSFTTTAACSKPTVTTNAAGSVTDTSALLSGSVNANGCQATSKIEWGPSSSPETYPNSIPGPSGTGSFSVSQTLSGLQPNTGYHYRISATNQTGTTPGPDKVFATPKTKYVALGDSYSSGVGTGSYFDTVNCYRSKYAYPELLASAHPNWTVVNRTCDNARTSYLIELLNAPFNVVTPDTKWVTYTIGGNDVDFGPTMAECARIEYQCWLQLDEAQDAIVNYLPSFLDEVNNKIKQKAPNAKVIVLNYPRLFNGKDCTTLYSVDEQIQLNATADMMKSVIYNATKRAGSNFTFLDVIPGFNGHAICDGGSGSATEWVNGPSFSPAWPPWPENLLKESFHPKISGQQVYYNLVRGITG